MPTNIYLLHDAWHWTMTLRCAPTAYNLVQSSRWFVFFFVFSLFWRERGKSGPSFLFYGLRRERERRVSADYIQIILSSCVCVYKLPYHQESKEEEECRGGVLWTQENLFLSLYSQRSIISNNKKKNKKNPSSYHMHRRRRRRRRRQGLFYLFFRRQQQQPWINSFSIIHRDDRTRVGSTIVTSSRGHTGHTARSQKHAAIWWCISNRSLP